MNAQIFYEINAIAIVWKKKNGNNNMRKSITVFQITVNLL